MKFYNHVPSKNLLDLPGFKALSILFLFFITISSTGCRNSQNIVTKHAEIFSLNHDKKNKEIEILDYEGKLITKLLYSDTLYKPVLYPLNAPSGVQITRSYPFKKLEHERTDHIHHTGVWFNYGEVNGVDYWNASSKRKKRGDHVYGNIRLDTIIAIKSGTTAKIQYACSWINDKKEISLTQLTEVSFNKVKDILNIEFKNKLLAAEDIVFSDSKEGLFAIRMATEFEMVSTSADNSAKVDAINQKSEHRANGYFIGSSGKEGLDVWGTSNKWVMLNAVKDNDSISVGIFDNENNFGYPAHWHARHYGLFSVNNFGRKSFINSLPPLSYSLNENDTITFKHKLIVKSNGFLTKEDMEKISQKFNHKIQ